MCHGLLFLFLVFSIFNSYYTAAACGLLLSLVVRCFTYEGLGFGFGSRFWSYHLVLSCSLFPGCGSFAGNKALAVCNDIVNGQDGEFLAMTAAMAEAFLGFVPEDNQFFAATLLNGSCEYDGVVYQRGAYSRAIGIGDEQDLIKRYLSAIGYGKSIDFERLAYRDFVLSSTTFNDCKHVWLFSFCVSTHIHAGFILSGGYVGGVGGGLPYTVPLPEARCNLFHFQPGWSDQVPHEMYQVCGAGVLALIEA